MTVPRTRAPASGQSGQSVSEPVTPAAVLVLLAGIERHDPGAPAATAFRTALKRKCAEAFDSGGPEAVERRLQEIAAADPDRAAAREAMALAVWSGLPGYSR